MLDSERGILDVMIQSMYSEAGIRVVELVITELLCLSARVVVASVPSSGGACR